MLKCRSRHNMRGEAGFTLVEIIVVMAISMLLLATVLVGQRGVRSRAQFDAAVNKLVATVSDARTQATAGVNIIGSGDGSSGCGGGPGGNKIVFAGVAWTADNALPGGPIQLDYYKANPGVEACKFQTQSVGLPAPLTVNAPGGRVLFVRNDQGGLAVCPSTSVAPGAELPSFIDGTCASGTLTLNLSDGDGHTSQVIIDGSGLARRVN